MIGLQRKRRKPKQNVNQNGAVLRKAKLFEENFKKFFPAVLLDRKAKPFIASVYRRLLFTKCQLLR